MLTEPVLTIPEIAELLHLSKSTASRLFENEPGVIVIDHPETKHKRGYRILRVPRPVFNRAVERLSNR